MNAVIRGANSGRAEAGDRTDGEADAQQAAAPPSFDGGARTTALTPLTPQQWLQGVLHERRSPAVGETAEALSQSPPR